MNPSPRAFGLRFWLITIAALLGMALTATLGQWQLLRAAEKEALQAAIEARQAQPPLDAAALLAPDAAAQPELIHRSVTLRGQWVPEATVFLDNRQMRGRPGFFVVTPLRLAGGGAVLVQRGWVPRDFEDRTLLPEVPAATGEVTVAGRVAVAPARIYELGTPGADEGASRIRQNLDLAAYGRETGLALAPLSVWQTGADSDGLQRDWPAVNSGIDKHYGYAFQWFGLCGLVAILYVWFQIVRRFLRPRSQPSA